MPLPGMFTPQRTPNSLQYAYDVDLQLSRAATSIEASAAPGDFVPAVLAAMSQALSIQPPPSSVLLAGWYLMLQHDCEIDNRVHLLVLWDLHGYLQA